MGSDFPPSGEDLIREVGKLADEGFGKSEIARRLGFSHPNAFSNRLLRASQQTGKPIPPFASRTRRSGRGASRLEVKRQGGGRSFGVYVPREPLERLGIKPGDVVSLTVGRRRIVLSAATDKAAPPPAPRLPRLVKGRKGRQER
jgi:hypothetical protein